MKKLVDVLVNPLILLEISLPNFSQIIAEAKYFNMLAQLEYICKQNGIWSSIPKYIQKHFSSASLLYENQCRKLDDEISEIYKVLAPLNVNWMFLKGSAYHLSNLKSFTGRMMADVDLLVDEKDLPKVEAALKDKGWISEKISNYDEKFYRNWAQEIPPLKHVFRQVNLDLHFNILPKTIKESLDGKHLFNQSEMVGSNPNQRVLKPHAMLVHSAIHLFYESDFRKGLRDLYDIAIFIKDNGHRKDFWQGVITLQENIGNQQSLYLALRYCQKIYNINIPLDVIKYYEQAKPNRFNLALLDYCFLNIFSFMYPPNIKFGYLFSSSVLYLRGHLKRMPIRLLVPHLTKKSIDKFKVKEEAQSLI